VSGRIEKPADKKMFLDQAPKALHMNAAIQPVLETIKVWTTFNGSAFDTEKPMKTKSIVPHPVNVGKISCEMDLQFKMSVEQKELTISGTQVFDPNGFAGLTRAILQQSGLSYRPQGKTPDVQMTDSYDFVFNTDNAVAKKASRTRTTVIDPLLKRVDRTTITIKPAS
jgi:hypothetical protein